MSLLRDFIAPSIQLSLEEGITNNTADTQVPFQILCESHIFTTIIISHPCAVHVRMPEAVVQREQNHVTVGKMWKQGERSYGNHV